MSANQETRRRGLNVIPFCIVGSARNRNGDLGAIEKQDEGRSVRSSPVYCSPGLTGLLARDPARAFMVDLLTAQSEIRIHRVLVFPPPQPRFHSPCRIRSSCSPRFVCLPLLRARLRPLQALGNGRLRLDPRRRTDVAHHQESHTGAMVMFPVLMMSARLNESDCSRSEFASMRRWKPRASR